MLDIWELLGNLERQGLLIERRDWFSLLTGNVAGFIVHAYHFTIVFAIFDEMVDPAKMPNTENA